MKAEERLFKDPHEYELAPAAIDSAYCKLEPTEAAEIDRIADRLTARLKARHHGYVPLMFGYNSALELIGKLGILLHKKCKP